MIGRQYRKSRSKPGQILAISLLQFALIFSKTGRNFVGVSLILGMHLTYP